MVICQFWLPHPLPKSYERRAKQYWSVSGSWLFEHWEGEPPQLLRWATYRLHCQHDVCQCLQSRITELPIMAWMEARQPAKQLAKRSPRTKSVCRSCLALCISIVEPSSYSDPSSSPCQAGGAPPTQTPLVHTSSPRPVPQVIPIGSQSQHTQSRISFSAMVEHIIVG